MATDGITHICEHEGCESTDTIRCINLYHPDDPENWYCPEHAAEEGFCSCCGIFSAGIESFDFIHPGLCDNCYDQIEADNIDDSESWPDMNEWSGFDIFYDNFEPEEMIDNGD